MAPAQGLPHQQMAGAGVEGQPGEHPRPRSRRLEMAVEFGHLPEGHVPLLAVVLADITPAEGVEAGPGRIISRLPGVFQRQAKGRSPFLLAVVDRDAQTADQRPRGPVQGDEVRRALPKIVGTDFGLADRIGADGGAINGLSRPEQVVAPLNQVGEETLIGDFVLGIAKEGVTFRKGVDLVGLAAALHPAQE